MFDFYSCLQDVRSCVYDFYLLCLNPRAFSVSTDELRKILYAFCCELDSFLSI